MSLFEEVRDIMSVQLKIPCERIMPESLLMEHLSMDFVDRVKLVIDLEEKYDIKISDEEVYAVATVGELVELVKMKRHAG